MAAEDAEADEIDLQNVILSGAKDLAFEALDTQASRRDPSPYVRFLTLFGMTARLYRVSQFAPITFLDRLGDPVSLPVDLVQFAAFDVPRLRWHAS